MQLDSEYISAESGVDARMKLLLLLDLTLLAPQEKKLMSRV